METVKKYAHLFFDLDGTLTAQNALIAEPLRFKLAQLSQDLVVVSYSEIAQMRYQLQSIPSCFLLARNGSHALHEKTTLWEDALTALEVSEIEAHIRSLPRAWSVPDENDLLERTPSHIRYSMYGLHAPPQKQAEFDPDGSKRHALLRAVPLRSEKTEVRIFGPTSLEYSRKGFDKGNNILRLITHQQWNIEDSIYFGDEIFPGGDDESVYGLMQTQGIRGPDQMLEIVETLFT
ncbi:MAG: HAD-IIB family hydrolase [Candidatus Pacebacteria bacterium]|nr:HAD-IIB family hydrolase [Candidatus Paceibacterota bacterium]